MKYKIGDRVSIANTTRMYLDATTIMGYLKPNFYYVLCYDGWCVSGFLDHMVNLDPKYHLTKIWIVNENDVNLLSSSGESSKAKSFNDEVLSKVFRPQKIDEEHVRQGRWLSGIEKYKEDNRPKDSPFKWL